MSNPFQTIQLPDQDLNRIQGNISSAFNSINGPFIGGNLIKNKPISTGNTIINHGLNRIPQVWVICDQDTNTVVSRVSWDTNSITLKAAASCIISLWVN